MTYKSYTTMQATCDKCNKKREITRFILELKYIRLKEEYVFKSDFVQKGWVIGNKEDDLCLCPECARSD